MGDDEKPLPLSEDEFAREVSRLLLLVFLGLIVVSWGLQLLVD